MAILNFAKDGECVGDVVLTNTVDRSMVHEKLQEDVQIELAHCFFVVFKILRVPNLVLHVLDFFLSGIKSHTSHHVCNCTQRNLAIQLSSFCSVFVF